MKFSKFKVTKKMYAGVLGASMWDLGPNFHWRASQRSQNSPADAPAGYKFGGASGDALS
jgi:hypothetical protein